jgi:hypothetical protein
MTGRAGEVSVSNAHTEPGPRYTEDGDEILEIDPPADVIVSLVDRSDEDSTDAVYMVRAVDHRLRVGHRHATDTTSTTA